MKKRIQAVLQRILGFNNYLFVFSLFMMSTLRWNKEERGFNHLLTLLKTDDVVLDIGANIGIMTALLAKKCKQGTVHAFEPVPENISVLNRIIKFLSLQNVNLHPIALGAETKEVEMSMPIMVGVRMQGLSHILHHSIDGYQTDTISYKVKQLPLDQFEEFLNVRISAIKIDVENYEQFVFKGALKLIKRDKPLIYCELWDNDNRKKCFEILGRQGYVPMVWHNRELVAYQGGVHKHQNFFFLPKKNGKN